MGEYQYESRRIKHISSKLWFLSACLLFTTSLGGAAAFSERTSSGKVPHPKNSTPSKPLQVTLQTCFTPQSILENVAVSLNPQVDASGTLSSTTLVRLSKQLVSLDNKRNNIQRDDTSVESEPILNEEEKRLWELGLNNIVSCLVSANWVESEKSLEAVVEGIKSASVISRLLPKYQLSTTDDESNNCILKYTWWNPLLQKITAEDKRLATAAQPHQLSGLKWAIECFHLSTKDEDLPCQLPQALQQSYDDLDLPFTIRPGFLSKHFDRSSALEQDAEHEGLFTIPSFIQQVDFRTEKIQTKSKRAVTERRQTAWQGDDHVPPFEYSGKSMERMPWSAVVATVRDLLHDETSHYYDGCLLNLYPDGGSGMRYHIDPEQGVVWDFETAVVSIGATRRFAFRSIPSEDEANNSKPHSYVLMDGDVTEMVRDCQDRFQHTLKTAEFKGESAPRISLVFKKTL